MEYQSLEENKASMGWRGTARDLAWLRTSWVWSRTLTADPGIVRDSNQYYPVTWDEREEERERDRVEVEQEETTEWARLKPV